MNLYEDFLNLPSSDEYFSYYCDNFCRTPISSHDGLIIKFRREQFTHAFYERSRRNLSQKDTFSITRAQRMLWIKKAIQDANIPLLAGWDKKKKRYDHSHRVCLVTPDGFVIVVRLTKSNEAQFKTCYLTDSQTVYNKIMGSPVWVNPNIYN